MEKKMIKIFSVELNFFILLIMIMFHGFSHGWQMDQATSLRAFLLAKMQAKVDPVEEYEKWNEISVCRDFEGGKMEDDVIESGLPGQPSRVMFKQYAGYVNVEKSKGRSLFYYFAEAVQNPDSKPLLLWLNGGPGCSSLGIGAMVEIGPFGVQPNGRTLYSRQFGWNQVANTLFLESPAGVGFSYSNTTSDYNTSGDTRTAKDTYTFLVNWFKRYPHYKNRDFYIAGESYAGFYIPELSDLIIKKNAEGNPTSMIQLKGIMIGNGIMNSDTDLKGSNDYLWSHALISDETYRGLVENCKSNSSPKCDDYQNIVIRECGKIDFSNIYGPICSRLWRSLRKTKGLGEYDPCELDYAQKYLNIPQVQEALHANRTKLPYPYDFCSPLINDWKDSPSTMFPIYSRLFASGLRILLYSGDVDAVVPVSGTQYSIDALKLKVMKPWHAWVDDTNEVAGYRVVYDGLTFATVRGAGHQVPQCQPRRALSLLKMFLANIN